MCEGDFMWSTSERQLSHLLPYANYGYCITIEELDSPAVSVIAEVKNIRKGPSSNG
jgi:hypothetical protein